MFLPAVQHILYLMLQAKKEEESAELTTKICPYCQSEISIKASRCPHCTSVLEETNQNNPGKSSVQIMRRAF